MAAASPRYVVLDCVNKAQVRPGGYVLTCADGNIVATYPVTQTLPAA